MISSSATRFSQEKRTLTHISSSISQITHTVFADTVSSYPQQIPSRPQEKLFINHGAVDGASPSVLRMILICCNHVLNLST